MCYSLWYNAPTMLPATVRQRRGCTITSCNTQSSAPEDGQNNCPKHVELIGIINHPLLLGSRGTPVTPSNLDARCSGWSRSNFGRFAPGKVTQYPWYMKLDTSQGCLDGYGNLALTGITSQDRPARTQVAMRTTPTRLPKNYSQIAFSSIAQQLLVGHNTHK